MKLQPHHLVWLFEVEAMARRSSWTTYIQSLKNQRQQDPSMVAIRRDQVAAIFARTSEPKTMPDVDRLEAMGMTVLMAIEDDRASRDELRHFLESMPAP